MTLGNGVCVVAYYNCMKQAWLATKTRKEAPGEEQSQNAILLIRAGYIHKTMAGVYSFLPLGLRSLNKIIQIIREEMNAIGGQETLMNGLQNPEIWKKSGRWNEAEEVWFHSELKAGGDVGLAWTHEEPVTEMMRHHVHSYRDLPKYIYQFQTKFRNEERAKSGIMRTREFIMKDLYSFSADESQHQEFYEQCAEAYRRIFERTGIGDDTYRTFAGGGAFSEFSDEFQTITKEGEDTIYIDEKTRMAVNKEVYTDEVLKKLNLDKENLKEYAAAEVGNIFTLGERFSEALDLHYTDVSGDTKPVFMGSYGIGPARLLGVIAEKYGSDEGMILPKSIAPCAVHLIAIGESEEVLSETEMIYQELTRRNIEVLYDDRNESAGTKFADSDLIGIPHRLIVSEKTRNEEKVEWHDRMNNTKSMVPANADAIVKTVTADNT